MDSQAKIKALRAAQRYIKSSLKSPHEDIRKAAHERYTELGLAIDAELLRQERRVISII
ncbi:hypothetical protein [Leptolyngbya phage Lbo-JY16]